MDTQEKEILELINQHRDSKGLNPLVLNTTILKEAKRHCEHMALGIVAIGHEGFDQRAKRLLRELDGHAVAENIASGGDSPQEVVKNWLQSDTHRQNIEGGFNQTAVAIERDKKGQLIYLQLFIATQKTPDLDALINTEEIAVQLFQLINQYRQKVGLSLLEQSSVLKTIALEHSMAMASGQSAFGHDGFEARASKALEQLTGKSIAENVANGNVSPQKIVEGWLLSDGHRKNIEGDFTSTGIGVEKQANGNLFYTQLFLKR